MALPILFRTAPLRRTLGRAPIWNLSSEMDNLFADFRRNAPQRTVAGPVPTAPRIDLVESEDQVRVSAELPGVGGEDLHVELKDGLLRLHGEKAAPEGAESNAGRHRSERSYGHFERTIRIPVEVEIETATAVYRDGVLEITLPKATSARVREIPVEIASA